MGPVPFPRTGAPAPRALNTAGYAPIGELEGVPMADVLALHGMGPKGVGALRRAMAEHGWAFGRHAASGVQPEVASHTF